MSDSAAGVAGRVATSTTGVADPAVRVRDLGFAVGGAVILADIDLTIDR